MEGGRVAAAAAATTTTVTVPLLPLKDEKPQPPPPVVNTSGAARLGSVAGYYGDDDRRKRPRDGGSTAAEESDRAIFPRGDRRVWSPGRRDPGDRDSDERGRGRDRHHGSEADQGRDGGWPRNCGREDGFSMRERNLREDRRLEALDSYRKDERRAAGPRGRDHGRVVRRERESEGPRGPYDRGSSRSWAERERERERFRERNGSSHGDGSRRGGPAKVAPAPVVAKEKEGDKEFARKYQLEVLDQAKVKNTIAFLETGAGKTLIAILLIKCKYELMRKDRRKLLAVFLVPKVPLVYQQAEVIREGTGFQVGHYCGEMGQDFWDTRRWQREFDTKDVLVMTAQILLNILRHSIVRMDAIHLLILDECHHAVKKHPYSLVMSEFYHMTPKESRPSVFGMTASPVNLKGVSNQEDCAIKIRNLESKLDSIVCTIKDRKELELHVPTPSESVVEYDKAAVLWSLREQIKRMEAAVEEAASSSSKRSKWQFMGARDAGAKEKLRLIYGVSERTESDGAASLGQKLRAIIYSLDELGQWCAFKVATTFLTSLRNDERANHQLDVKFQESYLTQVVTLLKCSLSEGAVGLKDEEGGANGAGSETEEKSVVEGKEEKMLDEVEEGELPDTQVVSGGEHVDGVLGAAVADGKVTPKVQSLIKILLTYQHTDDFRAIIFVERVVAALVLPKVFAELPSLHFVKCASLIGHNNNQDMRTRQMQETIAKFRDGRVNLLVATSVAEEGLDIRQCNAVIRFDLAKTVLAYIQSRGRARKPGSDYVLMLEKGNNSHIAFLRNARNSEETLRREAIERTELCGDKEASLLASLESVAGDVYQVPSTGAIVSLNSAVGLIHFYCSQLPTDRYSILRPEFIMMSEHDKEDGTAKYSCKLQLPCNAPIETVEGPLCSSIRGAQQTVCLEACKKLHEMGAFTDMLLPDKGAGEEAEKLEDADEGDPIPGTARHREYYPEGVAEVLHGDWIKESFSTDEAAKGKTTTLYMYRVACENAGFSRDALLTETSDFALLFGRELDGEVLSMTMDLFVARTMTTKVSLICCNTVELTGAELAKLKDFHVRVMSIVLDVNVEPATTPWDPVKAYLFVPIEVQTEVVEPTKLIHWDLIKSTLDTNAWENPLQRARPDVYLGTDERALGGDRREYGFGKLRYGQTFGLKVHPTYGIRGAVAAFDTVKAAGLMPPREAVVTAQEWQPIAGKLLMADGVREADGLVGRIVTAVHSGKRFYVESIRFEMNCESSFPRKEGYLGPLEYTSYADYYKQKYGVELACKKQALIRGRGVSHCKNLLSPRFEISEGDPGTSEEPLDKTYYVMLPPELCLVHPLPGPLVRGAQRLPSVMKRVESMLLAVQLKHRIAYSIPASKVLEALTAASCQETFCYERAELLGDAYLKWVVSRRLFLTYPSKHEGQLTRMRQQTVSNSVLYQYALERRLQSYIQADRFAPSRWAAPGVPPVYDEEAKDADDFDKAAESKAAEIKAAESKAAEIKAAEIKAAEIKAAEFKAAEIKAAAEDQTTQSKAAGTTDKVVQTVFEEVIEDDYMEDGEIEGDSSAYRVLSSKTLADVVEALIGVYYVEGGQRAATHLMNWIGIPVEFDPEDGLQAQVGSTVPESVLKSIDFDGLESAIGHPFDKRSLLVEAITHASRPSSGVPCYQRLEFVGDAVLDHLITRHLFFNYTDLPPGRLTDLRAAAVNNENFARLAVKHKFHAHLRHGSSALEAQIHDFVKDVQSEHDKPGVNSFGLGDFKAPKVLGDILESIAGAAFLDTSMDADKVWQIFEPLLQPMVTPETLPIHPVRELQERCQQLAEELEYKSARQGNLAFVEVYVDGVQIGAAQNPQKKMAQKLAARNALVALKENETNEEDAAKAAATENGQEAGKPAAKNATFTRQTLNDICLKQQWPMPQYKCVAEGGPAHAKRFTYSVRVHTTQTGWTEECVGEPMPSVKKAKDAAAVLLLEHLKR